MRWWASAAESSICAACLTYWGAVNLVGFHFILPGRYSYGVLAATSLAVLGMGAVARIGAAGTRCAVSAILVALAGLFPAWLAFGEEAIQKKDYFVFGFGIAVIATTCLAVRWWRLRTELIEASLVRGLAGFTLWWATICVLHWLAAEGVCGTSEFARFLRQQVFAIPFAGVVGTAVFAVMRLLAGRLNWRRNPN